ncbi:dnaJ homolog subfamily C member 17-like [Chenopodium quinoa]|uniref:dnaJ homolog subfamily C member 17-like n=1 Tax=Chenopodium quinoa TaxID=63459 RepID=UPI000B7703CE|nr:dnaJ homolog subfamily C member 17-like [Chenopodium quinoa]
MEEIDHYIVLGLVTGEEGSKLTEKEISTAYRKKAIELHPDKNLNDPDAPAKFQKLRVSYEILKDPKARKEFDDLLRVRREKKVRDKQFDAKRRRMMSDLEERERASFVDPEKKARDEEEAIMKKLAEEIARIKASLAKKPVFEKEERRENVGGVGGVALDKSKVLKVSWEKGDSEYSASRLRELFEEFGDVEDVVIKGSKKKSSCSSALVVMGSKEDAVAATGVMIGDLSNPLLVLPLEPTKAMPSVRAQAPVERDEAPMGNVVGAGFQAFEDSVLDKLRKAAEKQKTNKKET